MSSIRLTVKQRSEAGDNATEVILNEAAVTLGRDKTCQVVLAQQAVSRTHARITRDGPLFFIEDLGSAYGTTINGQKLPKGEKRLLRNGDVIAIAQFDVVFDRVAEKPAQDSPDKTSFVARQVVKDVMRGLGSGEGPCFRVMNGPKEGQRFEIGDAQELVVGRDETADIILKDDLISRRHAKIRRDWSGTHVEDLESRNGIKVNKKKVGRKTLKDRDEVEIGGVRLLYLDPTEVRETPVVLPSEEMKIEPTSNSIEEEPAQAEESAAPEDSSQAEEAPADEASGAASGVDDSSGGASGMSGVGDPGSIEMSGEVDASEGEASPPEDEDAGEQSAAAKFRSKLPSLGMQDKTQLVPLIVMGVFGLSALALVLALLFGA